MKYLFLLLIISFALLSCDRKENKKATPPVAPIDKPKTDSVKSKSYEEVLKDIKAVKEGFAKKNNDQPSSIETLEQIKDYWVNTLSKELYQQWKFTPWDFNGTTRKPKEGKIACGYFVITLLLDMGYKLDRIKLSTCDAMTMMRKLTSSKSIKNLSYLSYGDFNKKIKEYGKGVFIIGLDYHVGFLINDGVETWFLHSNYIMKIGVIKETISESIALKQSTSRFVTCLTCDSNFLSHWINK